ncbi:MAG: hypothetical protein RR008_04095, partial [Clostridia bacterium]
IVFSVTVTNYTKGKKLEVKITEVDGSTELTSATSKLSSIATSNSVSAIASEATESAGAITPSAPVTATITYTLKNLNQAPASTLPITLKVEIGEDPPKIITPAAPTGVSPNTNIPGATIQANNYDIYNLPCEATGTNGTTKYLLSWYSDSQHTNQVPYNNYTPSTPQTLYAKTSKYPLLPDSAITMSGNAITNINTTTADFAIPAKVGTVNVTT